jgi:hypothetical protein
MEPDPKPPWWRAPWRFLIETLVGLFIFGVIAAAAVAIKLGVEELSRRGIEGFIIWGLKGGEYALFGTDLVLFGRFLWRTGIRTWKEL